MPDRFLDLFEAEPIAKLLVDGDGLVLLANRVCHDLLGYPPGELQGLAVELLLPSACRERHAGLRAAYLASASSGSARRMAGGRQLQALRRDGIELMVEIGLGQIAIDGRPLTVVSMLDVGPRRQLRERDRALARARERNRELAAFAYIASHDLREPLRRIRAFVERLDHRLGSTLDADSRNDLDRITTTVTRMQGLIDNLLRYAVADGGEIVSVEVDLDAILADTLADLSESIERSGAEIQIEPLPRIKGDPSLLRQLFQNLLANAIKYAAPQRRPKVRVEVEPGPDDASCRLYIRDNGIGFDPRHAERIFEPFTRLHGRSDRPGAGIGLAIARRIVERHGGRISAIGAIGAGATFELMLPLPARGPTTD